MCMFVQLGIEILQWKVHYAQMPVVNSCGYRYAYAVICRKRKFRVRARLEQ